MSPSYHNHYGLSDYPVCSGHGVCIAGKCVCDSGWTDVSDFELLRGEDCDINMLSIKILSIITVIFACISLLIVSMCIFRDDMLSTKKRFKIKSLCALSFWLVDMSAIMYLSGKILAPPEYIVGKSIVTSIGMIIIIPATSYGMSAFFIILVNFLRSYARMLESQTRTRINDSTEIFMTLSPIVPTLIALCCLVLVVGVSVSPPEHSDKFSIGIGLILTMGFIYYALSVLYVLYTFLNEMHKFIENSKANNNESINSQLSNVDDIKAIYYKLRLLSFVVTPFLISGAPMTILFMSWYLMRRKLMYLFMLQIVLVTSLSAVAVWSLTTVKSFNKRIQPTDTSLSHGRLQKMVSQGRISTKPSVLLSKQISVRSKLLTLNASPKNDLVQV